MREGKSILPDRWRRLVISATWEPDTQELSGLKRDFKATVGNLFSKAKEESGLEVQFGVQYFPAICEALNSIPGTNQK